MRRGVLTAVLAALLVLPATASAETCSSWTQRTIASGLGSLENLAFDGRGGLLLSATSNNAIERLTPDGRVTTLVPGVNAPGGLAVRGRTLFFNTGDAAASGVLGRADGTLERFDLDRGVRSLVASGLTMPNGLAFLPDGSAVTSRDLGSGTGITRVTGDGAVQTDWAALDDTNGMAVDPTGTWLYADETFTLQSAVRRVSIADPHRIEVVAELGGVGVPKGLDDLTIDRQGRLYLAANAAGEVIRLDPRTGASCVLASGMQNTSAVKFGRGPGWSSDHLYVTGFDGAVRELAP
jgi:sugar lactone lactonase YvrE